MAKRQCWNLLNPNIVWGIKRVGWSLVRKVGSHFTLWEKSSFLGKVERREQYMWLLHLTSLPMHMLSFLLKFIRFSHTFVISYLMSYWWASSPSRHLACYRYLFGIQFSEFSLLYDELYRGCWVEEINKLLQRVLWESLSSYIIPALLEPKEDGNGRVCVDSYGITRLS